MKEPIKLLKALYNDFGEGRSTDGSRDLQTIADRLKNEGSSFLTITLPTFSEHVFQCIEKGEVDSNLFVGWRKRLCLPAFMQGFTRLVFDPHTGRMLNEPSVEAIRSIRQICNLYKKVGLPCTDIRDRNALEKFVKIDHALVDPLARCADDNLYSVFRSVSRVIVSSFGEMDYESYPPHHGPGSTFESVQGNKKYTLNKFDWYTCLEDFFDRSLIYNSEESYNASEDDYRNTLEDSTVRVITVPKTLKGPRTIAMEPVVIQMAQQSLKDCLVDKLEHSPLTCGHVNFTDQSINKRLALLSSKTRTLATLDMSDASDRIHMNYVWQMLDVNPDLRHRVFATRSKTAKVLGSELKLKKFASMGSALCFPVMSLYFYTVIIAAILQQRKLPPTQSNIYRVSRSVYVYGDDIIVPIDEVDSVVTALTKFGNVVNQNKSYKNSYFRESCGTDAYAGYDITPVYVRTTTPRKSTDYSQIVSHVATANLFYEKGLVHTFDCLKQVVECITGPLPGLSEQSGGLGWRCATTEKRRYNKDLQVLEVRTLVPCTIYKKDRIKGYSALSKCLLNLERRHITDQKKTGWPPSIGTVAQDDEHLDRTPRRGALTLKRRWITLM